MAEARRARFSVATWIGALVLAACSPAPEPHAGRTPPASVAKPSEATVFFSYPRVDRDEALTDSSLRERVSVLGFIATYDSLSQVQIRYLTRLLHEHTPRLNVALIALEPPENQILVAEFASAFELDYPVAMADAATIRGEGPFAGLHHVPSIVILDRDGVERFRNLGMMKFDALEAAVVSVERETGVGRESSPPAKSAAPAASGSGSPR
ncbi:MAG: TlpA family protein disulfide reductase [Polyangiaceae bacterium]